MTPLVSSIMLGETKGTGEETEGLIGPGLALMPSVGRVADGLTKIEEDGFPETVEERLITELEETTLLEEAGDWVGRLTAGSVGFKKTVEMTVIVTGPPEAGSVACGVPSEVEEGRLWDLVSAGGPPTEEGEEGSTENVEEGLMDKVEDGSTDKVEEEELTEVTGGLGIPLERVTLPPSNSASLRERSERPPSMV